MAVAVLGVGALLPSQILATPVQNTSSGQNNGTALELSQATVTLNRVGNAVSSAVAEISPNAVFTSVNGQAFTYDILPLIGAGDGGFDQATINLPNGYSNTSVSGVSVAGVSLSPSCPTPASGEYCATIGAGLVTIALGDLIATSNTRLQIGLLVDTPSTTGTGDFTASLDDSSTSQVPPQNVTAGNADGDAGDSNSISVEVRSGLVDPDQSSLEVSPPIVLADGLAVSVITATLRNSAGQPVPGRSISFASSRGASDTIVQPPGPSDANGIATGTISSVVVGPAEVSGTDSATGTVIADRPEVIFTQGAVLSIKKRSVQPSALVGDVIEFQIEVRNTTVQDVTQVRILDQPPAQFKFVAGSATLDGVALPDPVGVRPLSFDLGTVPALVDGNGNGEADPGEPGFALLSYNMVVGAGVSPGTYRNTAVAVDVCDQCRVSGTTAAELEIQVDPLFDLGTIIGKVFNDLDGDGLQDRGEAGIPAAMVVLDNGTYAITDRHGRYHFPQVRPGQRLVKINLASIAGSATSVGSPTRVLTLTEGLLAKANFGIRLAYKTESIGAEARTGVRLEGDARQAPVVVAGSAVAGRFIVNGGQFDLPTREVRMTSRSIDDVVEISGDQLQAPIRFRFAAGEPRQIENWTFTVSDTEGTEMHRVTRSSALPEFIEWDGRIAGRRALEAGSIYQYSLTVVYADGNRSVSPRRLFGVNRRSVIALDLKGGAFVSGSHQLTPAAASLLREAAIAMRELPDEKVVIAGHTDSVGSATANEALSLRRAQSALDYLVSVEGLPPEKFVLENFGESRPIASNATADGREQNRRVEIRGELVEIDRADFNKNLRAPPAVWLNGEQQALDEYGRFRTQLDDSQTVEVQIRREDGGGGAATVRLPELEILQPSGTLNLEYGQTTPDFGVPNESALRAGAPLAVRLVGRTDPSSVVTVNGAESEVNDVGLFASKVTLARGNNVIGVISRNADGIHRISNLHISVQDRDENGPLIVVAPVPTLVVQLPPAGLPLTGASLAIPGSTEPRNSVRVNDREVEVDDSGQFLAVIDLPLGSSELKIQVRDPDGNQGQLDRTVVREDQPLFMMALAETTISRLRTTGNLTAAGTGEQSRFVNEGRVAFYLKGRVLGKYLITSAFDSGRGEFGKLFNDLDSVENERLLTNLDPNTLYPVYGDDSQIVYDAQSQGKFYLGLESEQLNLLIGNYPLSFSDTELAAYQRTLYGVQATYQSAARTEDGSARSRLQAFAADLNQAHVRDELRATGGSLYYLSHNDIIEGSEQVSLVVRDQHNDMIISRQPQRSGADYELRYEQGRLLFTRPIASHENGNTLINQQLLAGNPVYVQVDYETRLRSFAETAAGARAKHQFGESVSLGATAIRDHNESGQYSLDGIDAEARLGDHTRILAELARSRGKESLIYRSDDGGLTYAQAPPASATEGQAFKLATEIDVGAMLGRPGQLKAGAYYKQLDPGFVSNGNSHDSGTTSMGLDLALSLGRRNQILARHDRRESSTSQAGSNQTIVRVDHTRKRLRLSAELQDRTSSDSLGAQTNSSTAGLSARVDWTERMATTLSHQESLRGASNSQTSAAMEYSASDELALSARATSGDRGQAAEVGARFKLLGHKMHLSQRFSAEPGSGTDTTTVIGTSTPFGSDGKVYTEYQWGSVDDYRNLRTLLGLNRNWELSEGLTLFLSGEHSSLANGQTGSDRYAIAAGLAFDNQQGLEFSSRNEYRRDQGPVPRVQIMTANSIRYALNPDFTLLGKYLYSKTDNPLQVAGLTSFIEARLGIAYRPVNNDRLNLLARYGYLSNEPMQLIDGTVRNASDSHVFSTDWSYQVSRHLEWYGKHALRIKEMELNNSLALTTHTTLSIQRVNVRLPRAFALGMEYRILSQREADNSSQGWLTELMWEHHSLLRVGVGFNFTDFSDNEFAEQDYSVHGWFIRLQGRY